MKRRRKLSRVVLCGSSLAAAVLCAGAAQAQSAPLSDQLLIYNAAGKVVLNMKILENSPTKPETTAFHGTGPAIKMNSAEFGDFTVLDDVDASTITISDIVGIRMTKTSAGPVYKFGFASDTDTASPKLTNAWIAPGRQGTFMPEPSQAIDVTKYLDTSQGSGQEGWHATFWSDPDASPAGHAAAPVPEPRAWAMLLAGLGAMGGALRTRRRQTTA
jgi:hypothetical protein